MTSQRQAFFSARRDLQPRFPLPPSLFLSRSLFVLFLGSYPVLSSLIFLVPASSPFLLKLSLGPVCFYPSSGYIATSETARYP